MRQYPEIVDYRARLGLTYYNMGNQILAKNPKEAVEYYRQSIDVRSTLAAEHPEVVEYRADLAAAYNNCASGLDLLKDDHVRDMHEQALALREQLVQELPNVPDLRNQLASSYFNLARFADSDQEKFALMQKSIDLRELLVAEYPDVPDYVFKLAFSTGGLGTRSVHGQHATGILARHSPDHRIVRTAVCRIPGNGPPSRQPGPVPGYPRRGPTPVW